MDSERMEMLRKQFGERIRTFREFRGWQLEDLGLRVNKSASTISRIEGGKQNLTMVDILLIAQALEIAPSALFGDGFAPEGGEALHTAKRSAQRCAKKGKEAIQLLNTLVNDLEVFATT